MPDIICMKTQVGIYNGKIDVSGWIIQPKLDGFRGILFPKRGAGVILSPNCKMLHNVDHIVSEYQFDEDFIFDGELLGLDWNNTATVVRASKSARESSDIIFYCFDVIPRGEYETNLFQTPQLDRLKMAKEFVKGKKYTRFVDYEFTKGRDDAWKRAQRYVEDGYEGAMVKNPNGLYKIGRSRDWQRLKFVDTHDIKVVAIHNGLGRNKNRLGYFACDFNGTEVFVGTGISDSQREEFWENRNFLIGKTIEVKCQEVTKTGSMRFPVFVRIRDDK